MVRTKRRTDMQRLDTSFSTSHSALVTSARGAHWHANLLLFLSLAGVIERMIESEVCQIRGGVWNISNLYDFLNSLQVFKINYSLKIIANEAIWLTRKLIRMKAKVNVIKRLLIKLKKSIKYKIALNIKCFPSFIYSLEWLTIVQSYLCVVWSFHKCHRSFVTWPIRRNLRNA